MQIEGKYIFKIYVSYIIYDRISSEMKQKESRIVIHVFSHVTLFLVRIQTKFLRTPNFKIGNL
jgi:hypothetical protein